ncbi:hypothetical protein O7627_11365 [Solwaraspora sp. WMMD1047]|uniref:hypothetical protein n=1 Tax=Solwaraspora sp. WMMD1047 TaxID=3016102 RepID=UPI002417A630|nr:hypothetical protein [Solwaraspora sp. WMMD1047]MDG4829900.1 hypothetical protein [Solwaraspora sp. WMMD1047]
MDREPREAVTHLEIQKLAYFLQVLGRPLRLAFTRGHYGPYAERLNRVRDELEGHYLIGYGDRSARVEELRPINLTPAQEPRTTDIDQLVARVRTWSGRKARLFTPEHIRSAHHRLRSTGLLPVLSNA